MQKLDEVHPNNCGADRSEIWYMIRDNFYTCHIKISATLVQGLWI
jgi:hypothetical protein